jgi:hypothetical protein
MLLGLFASGSYMLHSRRKVRKYYAFLIDLNEKVLILILPEYEAPYGPFGPPDPPALCKLLPLP